LAITSEFTNGTRPVPTSMTAYKIASCLEQRKVITTSWGLREGWIGMKIARHPRKHFRENGKSTIIHVNPHTDPPKRAVTCKFLVPSLAHWIRALNVERSGLRGPEGMVKYGGNKLRSLWTV